LRILDARRERAEDVVEEGARVVFAGGTVVYSDETGYRFGCDLQREDAVKAVCAYACEQEGGRMELCVGSTAELLEYAPNDALAALAVKHARTGPLSVLLKRPSFFSASGLAERERVAFFVPQEPLAQALLERCGPLLTCGTAYAGDGSAGLPSGADLLLERGEVAPRLEVCVIDPTRIVSEP